MFPYCYDLNYDYLMSRISKCKRRAFGLNAGPAGSLLADAYYESPLCVCTKGACSQINKSIMNEIVTELT